MHEYIIISDFLNKIYNIKDLVILIIKKIQLSMETEP